VRRHRSAPLVAVVLTGALLAPGAGAATAAPPDDWDPRIQRLVDFVERDRGLEFEHPVRVEFLSDAAFERRLRRDEESLTDEDRESIDQSAAVLRAGGLQGADVDAVDAQTDLDVDTVYGYYDFDAKEMVVRGTELSDVETRATVVHELTHALQDQRYDLDRLYDRARASGELFGLDALTEGDAIYVETDYVDTLPRRQQDEYYSVDPDALPATGEPEEALAGVPEVLSLLSDAPYTLGFDFAIQLYAAGPRALTRAFRRPPVSEEQIIDPVAWDDRDRPVEVATPPLEPGEQKAARADELGALSLYLLLASRIDPLVALDATTGWGGGRARGFTRDGTDCLRATVVGDTDDDTAEIAAALDQWAASLPAGMATVATDGTGVHVTSCATPDATVPDPERLDRAFYLTLDRRLTNTNQALFAGLPVDVAACVGTAAVSDPELAAFEDRFYDEGILDTDLPDDELDRYQELLGDAVEACGG
jgi:hypothetical protein